MRKTFSLLAFMLLLCTSAWGAETELFGSFSNTTVSNYFKDYTVGGKKVTVSTDRTIGSSSGDYYVSLGSTPSSNAAQYIEVNVSGAATIKTISFKFSSNNNSAKTCKPALLGWTSSIAGTNSADYATEGVSKSKKKGLSEAEYFSYDLSAQSLKRVRIYRKVTGISVAGADAADFGGGQTLQFYGVKIELVSATAPVIETQPQNSVFKKNATSTLTIEASPSSGSCAYQWYSSVDAEKTSVNLISGAESASYTVPTGTPGTFYYYCVVRDGGSNTTTSNVAKVYVIDRNAKQTWDFSSINAEDIKYNESFWTSAGSGKYNHNFTKATDGTLQDNYGNDLLNGIKVRREAGDAQVYVYSDKGINLQGIESKPGWFIVPVESPKYYKITYTSQTDGKTLGYTVGGTASYVEGNLTSTITTAFTNSDYFYVKATSTGNMTLTNTGGEDATACTLVKIEEMTTYAITLDKNGGSAPGSAKAIVGASKLLEISEPTNTDLGVEGYYADNECTNKIAAADGTLVADKDGYTDEDGKWSATEAKTLYAKWSTPYDINIGSHPHGSISASVGSATEGAIVSLTATPDSHYTLDSWTVYKTGEPATTVTVTDNKFTMPAYAVTVNATFVLVYANSVDFNAYVKANITDGKTSTSWTYLDDNKYLYSLGGSSALDNSTDAKYEGLKMKNNGDYLSFAVPAGKAVTFLFGYVKTNPKLSINGGSETVVDVETNESDNQWVQYAASTVGRIFKIKTDDGNSMVIKKIIIEPGGTISAAGWSTFSSSYPLDLTKAVTNGTVYYASAATGNTVTLSEAPSQVIRAGEGIMVKGTAGATFAIQTAGSDGTAIDDNLLKGQTTTGNVSAENHYVFGYVTATPSTYGFYALTAATEVPAGKAYLEYPAVATAPSFLRIIEEENNATSIDAIGSEENAVKFFENGQLYILREGVVYDALGRKVR